MSKKARKGWHTVAIVPLPGDDPVEAVEVFRNRLYGDDRNYGREENPFGDKSWVVCGPAFDVPGCDGFEVGMPEIPIDLTMPTTHEFTIDMATVSPELIEILTGKQIVLDPTPLIKVAEAPPLDELHEQLSNVLAGFDEHYRDFDAHKWWTTVGYEPTPWAEGETREFEATTKDAPSPEEHAAGVARERITSATGGAKESKLARFDQIPTYPLHALAEHYGVGNAKYPSPNGDNWRKGYNWSLSYAALQRHANAFWSGEDIDVETGHSHLTAVAWHAFTLLEWTRHPTLAAEFDDRQNR